MANSFSFDQFKSSSQWLIKNTPKDSIVLHGCWSEFPILFYHNDHNYYIVGLDPTFMYEYDKNLFWEWKNITFGDPPVNYDYAKKKKKLGDKLVVPEYNLAEIIKDDFSASYVFLEKERNKELNKVLEKNKDFEMVYEDEEAVVYKIQ